MKQEIYNRSIIVQITGFISLLIGYIFFSMQSVFITVGFWLLLINGIILTMISLRLKNYISLTLAVVGFIFIIFRVYQMAGSLG